MAVTTRRVRSLLVVAGLATVAMPHVRRALLRRPTVVVVVVVALAVMVWAVVLLVVPVS